MRSVPLRAGRARRLVWRLATVATAAVVATPLVSATTHASADTVAVTIGVWSQSGGQAPPTLPDGGLWANTTAGQTGALSAISFPTTSTSGSIVLHVHQATPPTNPYTLALCPADPPTWKPPATSPGAMSDAPKPACDNGREVDVQSIADANSNQMFRIELGPALITKGVSGNDEFNFVITAKSDTTGDSATQNGLPAPPATVDLTFEKINPATDIFLLGSDTSEQPSTADASQPVDSGSSASSSPSSSSSTDSSSSSFTPGATGSLGSSAPSAADLGGAPLPGASFAQTPPTAPAPATASPPQQQVASGGTNQALQAQPASSNKGPSDRDRILLGLAMLALLGWAFKDFLVPANGSNRRASLYDLPT